MTPVRVLHIEDSPLVQRLVEMTLESLGVELETRADGRSGVEAALADPPDVLILDIGLPGMSGWEVLTLLRADARTRDIAVLVLTAHAENEARANSTEVDLFMTKPFLPEMLRTAVQQLAESSLRAAS